MWFKSRNPVQDYHRAMIARHGADSSLALGWRNQADQLLRFEVLANIGDMNGRTVLDAGCGYADLYPFLKNSHPDIGDYYGIEQMPEMISRAKERYPEIILTRGDFTRKKLPVCDYVLASGSLNYGQDIYPAIRKLYNACTLGLGFNLLREISEGILQAHDPDEIVAFAQTLAPKVVLRADYAPEDFSVFLYR
jgi:SAM-dependent methyltransferase